MGVLVALGVEGGWVVVEMLGVGEGEAEGLGEGDGEGEVAAAAGRAVSVELQIDTSCIAQGWPLQLDPAWKLTLVVPAGIGVQ